MNGHRLNYWIYRSIIVFIMGAFFFSDLLFATFQKKKIKPSGLALV